MIDSGFSAIKFGAEWCAPCKTLDLSLKKIEKEFPNITFYSIDVDDENEIDLVKKYQLKGVPTVILLKDGIEVNRIVGSVLITPLRKAFRDLTTETGNKDVRK